MQNRCVYIISMMRDLMLRIVHILTFMCLSIATLLILLNVFTRYVVMDWMRALSDAYPFIQDGYMWFAMKMIGISGLADEIPGLLLVWIALCGAFLVHINDGHIAFDGVMNKMQKYKIHMYIVGRLAMVAFFAVLLYQSIRMILVGGEILLETIDIPIGYFMGILPIFAVLMILTTIYHIIHIYKDKE